MTKFYKSFPVLYGDCQEDGEMKTHRILQYMLETAMWHTESTDYPMGRLMDEGVSWMIYLAQYRFIRYPKSGEMVTYVTYPLKFDRFFAYRAIEAYNDDELLVAAKTRWFMYNFDTGKPAQLEDKWINAFGVIDKMAFNDWDIPRQRMPKEWQKGVKNRVYSHEIDFNHHANNTYYWNWMRNPLDVYNKVTGQPQEILISYKNQLVFNEELTSLWQYDEEKDLFFHKIETESGDTAAEGISLW